MSKLKIAVIPGDCIGWEVVPEGIKVLEAVVAKYGLSCDFEEFDWGCERYHKTGKLMPDDGIETLKQFDSIFLGACGYPGVPDHVSLWGLLIPIRREFRLRLPQAIPLSFWLRMSLLFGNGVKEWKRLLRVVVEVFRIKSHCLGF